MKSRKLHLSLLIFFQLAAIGTYVPIISIYLKDYLGFSSIQTGFILSVVALPSILSPFLSAWIVDRVITSRKLLILCSSATTFLILLLSFEHSYIAVLITYFLYTIFLVPTFALVHSLIFHNIEDKNSFGFIRSWGTVGWILAGWLVSFIWNIKDSQNSFPLSLQLSALFSVIVIILTVMLPKLELNRDKKVTIIPYEALEIIKRKEVLIILLILFLSSTVDKFISYGMPIFLNYIGVEKNDILVLLSFGQFPEVIMLFVLAPLITRVGLKKTFILAFLLQILRFVIFYINGPFTLTFIGTLFHGCVYPLFYAPASIYLDKFTNETSRGGIHQIYNLIFIGLAGIVGNLLAGITAENFLVGNLINFKIFWLIPSLISLLALIILIFNIKNIKN